MAGLQGRLLFFFLEDFRGGSFLHQNDPLLVGFVENNFFTRWLLLVGHPPKMDCPHFFMNVKSQICS